MMRSIHLYGKLKKEFGASHRFDVETAGEALRALNCAFPGAFVRSLEVGGYRVVRGARHTGQSLDMDLINDLRLGLADLHLIPVLEGAANSKGVVKSVLGVALIGGAIFMSGGTLAAPLSMMGTAIPGALGITWGNIAMVGLGLTLAGASTLLAKPAAAALDTDDARSHTFNGPGNTGQQGDAIPLIYGRTLTGSVPVSFDSDIEDVGAYQGGTGSLAA